MMNIYLIRHGSTPANEKMLYCGVTDVPLSESGKAALRSKAAAGGYPDTAGLKIYTSGLRRTEETLSILFGDLPHEQIHDLREMDFGEFEMRAYEELKTDPAYIEWISGENMKNRCPGGESGEIFTQRVIAAFEKLAAKGSDMLIVAHGGVIAAIMDRTFPEEAKTRFQWQPAQGEGYKITLKNSGEKAYSALPKQP